MLVLVLKWRSGIEKFNCKNVVAGIVLCIFNWYSTLYLLKRTDVFEITVFIPAYNIGVVVLASMIGFWFFIEKLSRSNSVGIFLAIVATIFLALGLKITFVKKINLSGTIQLFCRMKKSLILLIAVFMGPAIVAQDDGEIEKLKSELSKGSNAHRIETLKTLSDYYFEKNTELAQKYGNQYLQLSLLHNSKKDAAHANYLLGVIYSYELNYLKALQHHFKAIELFKSLNDTHQLAINYNRVATNLLSVHEFDSARSYNDSAMTIFLRDKYESDVPGSQILMGKIFNLSSKYDSAIVVFERVLNMPKLDATIKTWCLYWLGNTYYKCGKFDKAEEIILQSLDSYKQINDWHGRIGSLQMLGDIYLMKGKYADAYHVFFQSYENRNSIKGGLGKLNFYAQYFLNLGNVFFNSENYQTAIQHYDSALVIGKKYKFNQIIANAHEFLGHTYLHLNEYDLAFSNLDKALEIYSVEKNLFGQAAVLNRIGEVYSAQNRIDLAIREFQKALIINKEINNIFGISTNKCNLALCDLESGDFVKASQLLNEGLSLAKDSGNDELVMNYYKNFITICHVTGRIKEMHRYVDLFLELNNQINQSNTRNLTDLLIKYYENGLENEKRMFENELEIKNLASEKTSLQLRQMVYIIVIIVVLALVLIMLYVNKFLTSRKLEKIIEERTKTLRENEQKLIETNKTQDRLYSIIAHDLKSPFNTLIGFANLLQEEYEEYTDEERKKYIDIMRNSSEEIYFLLENLLEWTRNSLEVIQYKPVRFDLQKTLNQSITLIEKNAAIKNITINNDLPKNTFVFADENMVRAIVRNLVSNAIKFTGIGGQINVGCRQVNNAIECTVADSGVGIAPENIEKLFNVESTVKKKGTSNERGTGLGLVLCKEFVTKNGGTISVESELNKGSKFVFTLPAK